MGKKKNEDTKKEEKKQFRSALSDAYKTMNEDLIKTQEKDEKDRQEILREGIERVEKDSEKMLKSSKLLTDKIISVRKKAGLSSTIGTAGKMKKPMMFGKEDFKRKLKQEILVIGTEELEEFGGAMTAGNFVDYFKQTRPNWEIKAHDILQAIKEMEEEKIIPSKVEIGENEVLIRFKPLETSSDIQEVLQLATGLEFLTKDMVSSHLGWPIERAIDTLRKMVEMGLAVTDKETGEYYFPGIYKI